MNDCDPSEHQIFDTCVFIVDITSLENQHDQDTLGRVSRYIKERGGCVLVATSTDPASASIEIRPMPSQRMQCTHIIAEYGCKGERWNALVSEASKRHLDMHAVQVVNLVWVFACLQAHKLLPCHVDVYKGDTGSIGENAKDCTGRDECAMIYADDTMDVRMSASCSGFKKTARKLVEVMTASLGITFHKAMHVSGITKTDVLIVLDTSDESSEKLHAARNANIPVVNFIWLLDSYKEWKLLPLNDPRYKNGSESDLDRLIIDTAEYNDPNSVNVVPDSVDHSQESIQECSQTPPLENISDIPGANLAALQTASSGHTKEDIHNEKEYKSVADDVCSADAVHPISQDLSSTPSGLGDHSPRKTGTHLERENSGNVDGVTNNDDNDANISPHRDEAERAASDDDEEEGRHIDSHPAVGAQTTKRRRSSRLSSRNDPKIESEPDQRSNITREVDNTATKKRKKRNDDAPHIALSGMHSKEQHECIKLLRALQVPFTAGKHSWSPKFTHIITSSLRRNQKCLCALACGAWILHPSFVKASLSSSHQLAKEVRQVHFLFLLPFPLPPLPFLQCFLLVFALRSSVYIYHAIITMQPMQCKCRNRMKFVLETRLQALIPTRPHSGEGPLHDQEKELLKDLFAPSITSPPRMPHQRKTYGTASSPSSIVSINPCLENPIAFYISYNSTR